MSKLYLVPTPIGNLEDMTLRGIRILKEVDFILAEDTRDSGKLLKHFEIATPMHSHHAHNEHKSIDGILNRLKSGETAAVITDAGTPAISDPGYLIVHACVENGIEVECLPGATAFVPALVNSGLPNDRFVFEGFLPRKKGRKFRLEFLATETRTMIIYESPYKILKTLADLITYMGENRAASISRELTKLHEETIRGSLSDLQNHFKQHPPKGEFVLILAGKE